MSLDSCNGLGFVTADLFFRSDSQINHRIHFFPSIQNSSMSNTLILDPFGGSGSTLIACEQTDRDCYTIELDEKYCDVIVKRYIEQVGSADSVSVERDGKTYTFAELEVSDE